MRTASEDTLALEQQDTREGITSATFKLPRGLLADFRAVAQRHERTLSQELRLLMIRHVEAHSEDSIIGGGS